MWMLKHLYRMEPMGIACICVCIYITVGYYTMEV